jgi:hypothetical protein
VLSSAGVKDYERNEIIQAAIRRGAECLVRVSQCDLPRFSKVFKSLKRNTTTESFDTHPDCLQENAKE